MRRQHFEYRSFCIITFDGFSPFYIERMAGADTELAASYDLLSQLVPLILQHQGKDTMGTVLLDKDDPPQEIRVGDYTLHVEYMRRHSFAQAGQSQLSSSAIFIATRYDEYVVAGSGVTVTFSPNTPGPPIAGLATVEEGTFVDGRLVPGRRLTSDDTAQGESLQLRSNSIQRVTLYRYR